MNRNFANAENQENRTDLKNHLLDALPPKMTAREFYQSNHYPMLYPNYEEFEDRYELLEELLDSVDQFWFVKEEHYDLYEKIHLLIRRGYKGLAPTNPKYIDYMYSIAAGEKVPFPSGKTTAETAAVVAFSGVGKTSSIERILSSCFDQVIKHSQSDFQDLQITYVKVKMHHDGSRAELLKRLLQEVDRLVINAGYPNPGYANSVTKANGDNVTVAQMVDTVRTVFVRHHVGMFVIDEVQVLSSISENDLKLMIQMFDDLINNLKIPHLKVGTTDLILLFSDRRLHQRRLGEIIELARITDHDEMEAFNEAFFADIERSINVSSVDDVINEFWVQSAGILSTLLDLFQTCLKEIVPRNKTLTPELISKIMKKHFGNQVPALQELRVKGTSQVIDFMTVEQMYKFESKTYIKSLKDAIKKQSPLGGAAQEHLDNIQRFENSQPLSKAEKEALKPLKKSLQESVHNQSGPQTIEGGQ